MTILTILKIITRSWWRNKVFFFISCYPPLQKHHVPNLPCPNSVQRALSAFIELMHGDLKIFHAPVKMFKSDGFRRHFLCILPRFLPLLGAPHRARPPQPPCAACPAGTPER